LSVASESLSVIYSWCDVLLLSAQVAAALLLYQSEEQAFWTFVNLMDAPGFNLRGLFDNTCPALPRLLNLLECALQRHCPRLYAHFSVRVRLSRLGAVLLRAPWNGRAVSTLARRVTPVGQFFDVMICAILAARGPDLPYVRTGLADDAVYR